MGLFFHNVEFEGVGSDCSRRRASNAEVIRLFALADGRSQERREIIFATIMLQAVSGSDCLLTEQKSQVNGGQEGVSDALHPPPADRGIEPH